MFNAGDVVLKEIYKKLGENYNLDEILQKPSRKVFSAIYHSLIYTGVDREDRKYDVAEEDMFRRFCERGRQRANTTTFVDPGWPYFCQFISRDLNAKGTSDHIKVYIPLDHEHLERGANGIFDFLDQNHISHESKIGKRIRFDNIVIRLTNKEDLDKLLSFVDNNKYIQEGLIKPNPFAFVHNRIALASDGHLSYNSTVANYMMLYFIDAHKKKKDVNIKDFYHFVIDYYAKTFVSHENLEQFSEDFSCVNADGEKIDYKDPDVYNDYMFVSKLIVESQAKDYNLNRFISHFNLMHSTKIKAVSIGEDSISKTLQRMIATMLRKKDSHYTLWNIEEYIRTGQPTYLTRFEDCRNQICNSTFREDYLKVIKSKGLNLREELLKVYHRVIKLDPEIEALLRDFFEIATPKYGDEAIYYLDDYVNSGDAAYITREGNLRNRFIALKASTYLKEYIALTGISLEDIVNGIIKKTEDTYGGQKATL